MVLALGISSWLFSTALIFVGFVAYRRRTRQLTRSEWSTDARARRSFFLIVAGGVIMFVSQMAYAIATTPTP
jgi:amino acid transporter